jgi:hypothetical protein
MLPVVVYSEICSYYSREQDVGWHVFRRDKLLTYSFTLQTLHLNFHVAVKHHNVIYLEIVI